MSLLPRGATVAAAAAAVALSDRGLFVRIDVGDDAVTGGYY